MSPSHKPVKCFALSSLEKEDGTRLVAFAQKVPSMAKDKDKRVNDRMEFYRQSFLRNLDLLWRNPSVNDVCFAWLQGQVSQDLQVKLTGAAVESSSSLQHLDETFASKIIVRKTNLTEGKLEVMCTQDPDLLRQLNQYLLVSSLSLKIPEEYRAASVLEPVLLERIDFVDRASALTDKNAFDEGSKKFKWKTFGVYSLEVEGSLVLAVIHNPTTDKAVMPKDAGITTSFKLIKNWSDFGAAFQLRKLMQPIHEYFGEGRGPQKIRTWSGRDADFLGRLENCKQRVQELAGCSSSASTKRFREEERKKSQEQTAKKARASLKEKMDKLRTSREMVIE